MLLLMMMGPVNVPSAVESTKHKKYGNMFPCETACNRQHASSRYVCVCVSDTTKWCAVIPLRCSLLLYSRSGLCGLVLRPVDCILKASNCVEHHIFFTSFKISSEDQ